MTGAPSVTLPEQFRPFLLVVAVLTITPGPDMALVLRQGAVSGSRAAWWTGLGCCSGIAVWAVLAALGLPVLLDAAPNALLVVKIAGACYLAYLGVRTLFATFRPASVRRDGAVRRETLRGAYRQGLVSNVLNPKIAILFLTLIPQFIGVNEAVVSTTATLTVTFLAIAVVWWRAVSLFIGALSAALSRPAVQLTIERITGVVLILLGVRVAIGV